MADKYIHDLSFAGPLSGTDTLLVDQGGDARKASITQLKDAVGAAGPLNKISYFTHMAGPQEGGWSTSGGAPADADGYFGVYRGSATSASTSAFQQGVSLPSGRFKLGSRELCIESQAAPALALLDASDVGGIFVGAGNSLGYNMTSFVAVRSVNGGNYTLVAATGGVETRLDLGIAPVVGTFRRLGVLFAADGLSVRALVDGVPYGTPITTNLPSGVGLTPQVWLYRAVAMTYAQSHGLDIDWAWVYEP